MDRTAAMKAFFDQRAATWDQTCRHDPHKIAALVTLAQVSAGKRVLDIACGTGVLTPELLSRNPQCVLGVDLSSEMIARAKQKCQDDRAVFEAVDLFALQPQTFDVAILYSAYPHFPDKPALAAQTASLLAAGGRFLVAHSESRQTINARHHNLPRQDLSYALQPVSDEAAVWGRWFTVDMTADTDELYFFSGVKR